MSLLLSFLFTGAPLGGSTRFLLMLPLCLSIAVVYKTTRMEHLRRVPMASIVLWITIVGTMYGVGVGLWVLFLIMA